MSEIEIGFGILIVLALAAAFWGPYLWKEIVSGKEDVTPTTPTGPSETHPGTRFDPAPGHPDGQADPYSARAQRNAPHVKS